jgi:UrcA family protein
MINSYSVGAAVRRTAKRTAVLAFTAAAILGATANAHATEPYAPPQMEIRYSDLNLQTSEGAKRMYTRLRMAARTVCENVSTTRDIGAPSSRERCYQESLSRAVDALGAESVAALHRNATSSRVASQNTKSDNSR